MFGKRFAQGICVTAASALTFTGAASAMAPFSKLDFPALSEGVQPFGLSPVCDDDEPDGSSESETSFGTTAFSASFSDPVAGEPPFGPDDFGEIAAGSGGEARLFLADCGDPPAFGGPGATPDATDAVVGAIAESNRFCGWMPAGVRVDCVADRLRTIARDLPRGGDYAPVRRALEDAALELSGIARSNRARGVSAKRYAAKPPEGGPVLQSERALVEIAPGRIAAANAAAARVIEETQTVLLRSTENSRARMVAYQDVAAALESTKVLLRSA